MNRPEILVVGLRPDLLAAVSASTARSRIGTVSNSVPSSSRTALVALWGSGKSAALAPAHLLRSRKRLSIAATGQVE